MKVYYQKSKKRLVYIGSSATPDYWDDQWNEDLKSLVNLYKDNSFVSELTRKYIKNGGVVVEGGCGRANHVYSLAKNGYRAIGIDYAKKTVDYVNKVAPNLDVRLGDVRQLDLESDSVDGYWSIGVIEHFYDGYKDISEEMFRVLKSGGFLFITIPSMSKLRKLKAKLGMYDCYENSSDGFYQFALDPDKVIKDFLCYDFKLISKNQRNGFKGLKDESPAILQRILQFIYNSNLLAFKALGLVLDKIFSKCCGHTTLIILQKK